MRHPVNPFATDKSFVAMGYHLCPVCGAKKDAEVLLDKRLRPMFGVGEKMLTELELCDLCMTQAAEYVALVALRSMPDGPAGPFDFTGDSVRVRRSVLPNVFDAETCASLSRRSGRESFAFISVDILAKLREAAEGAKP